MEKSSLYLAFIALLKAGIHGEPPACNIFPLNDTMWKQVFDFSRTQTVEGIIFDGIILLPERFLPPLPILMKWTAVIDRVEYRNKQMNAVVVELGRLFQENGIRAFLLKGQGVAACYPYPLHRICGDADWCFTDKKEWMRANALIGCQGIPLFRQAGFSTIYEWKGYPVEHHQKILDLHNPFHFVLLNRLYEKELPYKGMLELENGTVSILSPLLIHLSLITHILKHMLSFGIGIRQLCDVACVYKYYYQKIDGSELEKLYRTIGIHRFVQALNTLLVEQLGISVEFLPFPLSGEEKYCWMMEDVLRGGNFGFYDNRKNTARKNFGENRKNVIFQIVRRFWINFPYAPGEVCCFPFIQAYSHISKY